MTIICHQKLLPINTTSLLTHLEIGLNREKSDVLDPVLNDCITQKILEKCLGEMKQLFLKETESYMQGSLPTTKKKTLKDKPNSSKVDIQKTDSLETLEQVSTGKEKGLKPFWKQSTKELSQKLWSPIKTDCVDLDLNSLNGSVKNTTLKSWLSIRTQSSRTEQLNCQKTYSLLSQSLSPKITDSEHLTIVKEETNHLELKTRKVRIFPNREQKQKLDKWFGIYRFVYNKGLSMIKKKEYPIKDKDSKEKAVSLKQHLRNNCVKDAVYNEENEWAKDLPADTRDYAITELLKNFRTNLDHVQNFQMAFKSKLKSQSIEIRKRQYNASRGKYSFLSEIKKSEQLPEIEHDIKIQKDFIGNYHLCIPIGIKKNENQVPQKMISIDPGVRTFLTGYSPDGYMYHIGENDIQRLCRLNHYKNKLEGSQLFAHF